MDLEQGFRLDDLRGLWRRRRVTMLAIGGASVLISLVVAGWIPNSYLAATTLLIEPQSISERLVEPGVPETELNNRLHLLQMQILSRGRLSQVIDEFNVYPELADEMTRAEVIDYMREEIFLVPVLPELATEARARIGARANDITVTTFQLQFAHRSPRIAADVANRLANSFIEEHLRDRTAISGDTREFIQEELRRQSIEIARVEKEIADVKTANSGALPEDFEANQRLHERLMQNLRDVQRELSIAASDEAFYHQQALAGGGTQDLYSMNAMTPRRRVEMLQLQLSEYRSRGFTDKHPDVIAAKDEIAGLEKEIEAGANDPNSYSPIQQNARFEMQRAALRAQSGRKELEDLQQQLQIVEERLAKTPRVAEQLGALEREHEHLFESYQEFSRKRLEAGVAADMESRQKGEKFRVLEQAVAPPEPTSPNRPLIIAVGVLIGLVLAAAYGIATEALDTSFHSPRTLQERLGLPVLAAIPSVVLPSDIAARRRTLVRQIALAGVATVVVIVASGAGYYWQSIRNAPGGEAAQEAPAGG
ncbi:MAG TPA: GNVR domain-containing protein [Myxococcota bacterium]|nr:GNVR domain-containing protein [Myxococcota bacterium]